METNRRVRRLAAAATMVSVVGVTVVAGPAPVGALPLFSLSASSLDVGEAYAGTRAAPATLTLTNVSAVDQAVGSVGSSGLHVSVGGDCAGATLAPGGTCTLEIGYRVLDVGPQTETVTITAAGESFAVDVAAVGLQTIAVEPLDVDLGAVPLGDARPFTAAFVNRSADSMVLDVAGAFGSECDLQPIAGGGRCEFTLSFLTDDLLGPQAASYPVEYAWWLGPFSMHTSSLATVSAAAESVLPISPDAAAVDFGAVVVGTEAERALSFTNRSGHDVTPTIEVPAPGGDLSLGADGCTGVTVAPGGSCELRFSFAPTAVGAVDIALALDVTVPAGEATASGTGEVRLTGEGVVAGSSTTTSTVSTTTAGSGDPGDGSVAPVLPATR